MFAICTRGGLLQGGPDVCKTPVPPAGQPAPVTYTNVGNPPMGLPVAEKVFIGGMPALTKKSEIAASNGDQPGVQGGVASGQVMGKITFFAGSATVMIAGSPAVKLGDATTQNNNNCAGACLVPSQVTVMIMG